MVNPSGDYCNASRAQEQIDGGEELLELRFEVRLATTHWEVAKTVCDRAATSFWHAFLNKEHQLEWEGAILACETQVHVAEGLSPNVWTASAINSVGCDRKVLRKKLNMSMPNVAATDHCALRRDAWLPFMKDMTVRIGLLLAPRNIGNQGRSATASWKYASGWYMYSSCK